MTFKVRKQHEGVYEIFDDTDGERVARVVARFHPGPMVSYSGDKIMSPPFARAVSRALRRLVQDLERETHDA